MAQCLQAAEARVAELEPEVKLLQAAGRTTHTARVCIQNASTPQRSRGLARSPMKALDASESMEWPVTPAELRDREQEIEGLRTEVNHIKVKLLEADRELTSKASTIENLEV